MNELMIHSSLRDVDGKKLREAGVPDIPEVRLALRVAQEAAVTHATDGRPQVALTFDDGPSAEHTPAVLDRLAYFGVRAAFFLVASWGIYDAVGQRRAKLDSLIQP